MFAIYLAYPFPVVAICRFFLACFLVFTHLLSCMMTWKFPLLAHTCGRGNAVFLDAGEAGCLSRALRLIVAWLEQMIGSREISQCADAVEQTDCSRVVIPLAVAVAPPS